MNGTPTILAGILMLQVAIDAHAASHAVTVRKEVALIELSRKGAVTGIEEARIGQSFSLVKVDGVYLVLQDTGGKQFRIERSATDFAQLPPTPLDNLGGPLTNDQRSAITQEGIAQLEKMLADRPAILTVIQPRDPIWDWLAYYFSNQGHAVIWSAKKLRLTIGLSASDFGPAEISLWLSDVDHRGKIRTAQTQLSAAVFELLNIQHRPEFEDQAKQARAGQLSKAKFVRERARTEFHSVQELKNFYALVWLPYAKGKGLDPEESDWWPHATDNFEVWLKNCRQLSGYPENPYEKVYASLVRGD